MPERDGRNPIPEGHRHVASNFFDNYDVFPGSSNPEHEVGVFQLDIEGPVVSNWIRKLRACLPGPRQGDRYVSQGPDNSTHTDKFILKKRSSGGVNIQLRGLQGLETPITVTLRLGVGARIHIPFNVQPEGEDARSVVEQLGKDYWMGLPNRIRKYYSAHPPEQPDNKALDRATKPPLDPEIVIRIEDIVEYRLPAGASVKKVMQVYNDTFPREKLSPDAKQQVDREIQRIRDKLSRPPSL